MPDGFFGQRQPQPLRLAPEPDERACGFVLRIAARNLCSGNEMAGWLGLGELGEPLDMDPGPSARLLGIEADGFAHMGFGEHEEGWVLDHRVPINRPHRTMRFFCPDCLAEAPYHRRIWSLRQLTSGFRRLYRLSSRAQPQYLVGPRAGAYSDASQPVIPAEASHPFRGNPATSE